LRALGRELWWLVLVTVAGVVVNWALVGVMATPGRGMVYELVCSRNVSYNCVILVNLTTLSAVLVVAGGLAAMGLRRLGVPHAGLVMLAGGVLAGALGVVLGITLNRWGYMAYVAPGFYALSYAGFRLLKR
jgi:hypothetical protein